MDYEVAAKHPMDWIHAHVEEPISHLFVEVDAVKGDFVAYTGIAWSCEETKRVAVLGDADEMVKAVEDKENNRYPETMLRDICKKLMVTAIPGRYVPISQPEPTVNPVGERWPQEDSKWNGAECYHPTSGLSADQLVESWTDGRGSFSLKKGMSWWTPYYLYVKVA